MAPYSKLNLVPKAMLYPRYDQVGAFGRVQLLLQVGLVEPHYAQLSCLIRNSSDCACKSLARANRLNFPDHAYCSSDLVKGNVRYFFEFAIVAMLARKIKEQVPYGAYAQAAQFARHGRAYTRNSSNISAQQCQRGMARRHALIQVNLFILSCLCSSYSS